MDKIKVKVNGSEFGGWTTADISKSVEDICGTFSLTVINSWSEMDENPQIKAGDLVEIYMYDDVKKTEQIIMTGYVDIETPGFNNNGTFLNIAGRDVTCDLVDCTTVPPFNRKGLTPVDLIFELLNPPEEDGLVPFEKVGLSYSADLLELPQYEDYKVSADSKISDEIKKISNRYGFLAYTNENGQLTLTTKTRLESKIVLEEGVNVMSASKSYDMSKDYHRITVYSQKNDDGDTGKKNTKSPNIDSEFPRYRPLNVIHSSDTDEKSTEDKAKWIKRSITSSSTEVRVEVVGWQSTLGEPYAINTAVTCKIPSIGIDLSYNFMIKSLSFMMSEDGQKTRMVLVHKDVYNEKGNIVKDEEAKKSGSYAKTKANEFLDSQRQGGQ